MYSFVSKCIDYNILTYWRVECYGESVGKQTLVHHAFRIVDAVPSTYLFGILRLGMIRISDSDMSELPMDIILFAKQKAKYPFEHRVHD